MQGAGRVKHGNFWTIFVENKLILGSSSILHRVPLKSRNKHSIINIRGTFRTQSNISKMEFFLLKIVNGFQSFTIFAKSSILNFGSETAVSDNLNTLFWFLFVDIFAYQMIQHMLQWFLWSLKIKIEN